jgi:rhamnogalacturonan endolyase
LWEVGTPNRYATEFYMSEKYNIMNIAQSYPEYFPNDVTFTIGQSEVGKDWFFQHVPHYVVPTEPVVEPLSPSGRPMRAPVLGKATPYTINFDLAAAPKGTATLRLAITGSGAPYLDIAVNGKEAGRITNVIREGAIARHGSHGLWHEDGLAFDASLMRSGTNTLVITVPEGSVDNGMLYDYLRLELDESATL